MKIKTTNLAALTHPLIDLAPSKSPLESMRCIHFKAEGKLLLASARDAVTTAWTYGTVDYGPGDGTFSLYADVCKKIVGIAQQSKEPEIQFDLSDHAKIEVKIGSRHLFKLKKPDVPFPQEQTKPVLKEAALNLPIALKAVVRACGTDASLPNLTGVYFDPKGGIAAIDGPRLHVYQVKHGLESPAIVPSSFVRFLSRFGLVLDVGLIDDQIFFDDGHLSATCHLLPGPFPNYSRLLSKPDTVALVKPTSLEVATEDVMTFSDGLSPVVQLNFDKNGLVIQTIGSESFGEAWIDDVVFPTASMPENFRLNARYLIDALKCFDPDERVAIGTDGQSVSFRTIDGEVRAVVGVSK